LKTFARRDVLRDAQAEGDPSLSADDYSYGESIM